MVTAHGGDCGHGLTVATAEQDRYHFPGSNNAGSRNRTLEQTTRYGTVATAVAVSRWQRKTGTRTYMSHEVERVEN